MIACRSLGRNWKFTFVVILTLSLGMGANSAVMFVMNALMFRPLPYTNSDRVVNLWSSSTGRPEPVMTVSYADFVDWKARSTSFSEMAAFAVASGDLVGNTNPENVAGSAVSTNFFDVLEMKPMLGRTFDAGDDKQPVIVLAYSLWQRHFGSQVSAIGAKLLLSGKPYTIIGVMPPKFMHPEPLWEKSAEFWRPIPDFSGMGRGARFLRVVARLKPSVSFEAAAAEMKILSLQLAQAYPQTNSGRTALMVPLRLQMFGEMYRSLFLLFAVAAVVLLVACANVTNLQLVRSNSRILQMLVRMALGARPRQLFLAMLGESMALALMGAAGGICTGYLALHVLRLVAPASLHGLDLVTIDGRMVLFALLLALLCTLLIAIPPSIRFIRLRAGSVSQVNTAYFQSVTASRQRTQSVIMAAQLALVLPLLIATVILARSFFNLVHVEPGFDPRHMLTLRLNLPQSRYRGPEVTRNFFQTLRQSALTIPGVRSVALTSAVPLTELNAELAVGVALDPSASPGQIQQVYYRIVSEDFLATFGTPLLSGRSFTETDTSDRPRVAIVNASFVKTYLAGQDPIGKTVFLFKDTNPVAVNIVGMAGDMRFKSLAASPVPEIYLPFAQDASLAMAVIVRTDAPPETTVAPLRDKVAQLDRQLPLRDVETMERIVYNGVSVSRFAVLLMALSSMLTFILALIGVGGIVAYIVSERTREYAIRIALGATRGAIIRSLMGHIVRFGAFSVVIGLALAVTLNRIPAHLIYGVRTLDIFSYSISVVAMIAAVFMASYLSLRGVLRIDPASVLKTER